MVDGLEKAGHHTTMAMAVYQQSVIDITRAVRLGWNSNQDYFSSESLTRDSNRESIAGSGHVRIMEQEENCWRAELPPALGTSTCSRNSKQYMSPSILV